MRHKKFTLPVLFMIFVCYACPCLPPLSKQKTGTKKEVEEEFYKKYYPKDEVREPPYERKIYYNDENTPSCLCGNKEVNYKRWNLFHVHTKPKDNWNTCMATPISSNILLTSHHCLIPPDPKWYKANAGSLARTISHPISPHKIKVTSIAFTGLQELGIKRVIFHPNFTLDDWSNPKRLSGNDVAIIVIRENIIKEEFNTFCLPPPSISASIAEYQRSHYIGSGGEFPEDKTIETRFVLNSVIMRAADCVKEGKFDVKYTENSLCIRFRDDAPQHVGGSLTLLGRGPDPTPYLVGLAGAVGYELSGTSIKYAFFTNILPHVTYIEEYAKQYDSWWCEAIQAFKPPSQISEHFRSINPYPWETPATIPPRDETLDCVCGLRTEFFDGKYQNFPPQQPPPPGRKKRNAAERSFGIPMEQPRISGGSVAKFYEFPWMVILLIGDIHAGWSRSICGASIINDKMVLTAAHCVTEKDPRGELVTIDTKRIEAWAHVSNIYLDIPPLPWTINDPAKKLEIEKVEVHPDYEHGRLKEFVETDADIALLILKDKIVFPPDLDIKQQAIYRPICLPRIGVPLDLVGIRSHLTGWGHIKHPALVKPGEPAGRSEWLKIGVYPVRPLEECASYTYGVITHNMICATSLNVEDSALPGDSGGPQSTILAPDGLHTQIGLTSFGDEFYQKAHPGIHLVFYTNLQKFLRFIDYHAAQNGAKWCDKSKL